MMKTAVMISVQPKWCEKISSGEKTIEVRKTVPKRKPPFKCYIYCTKGNIDFVPSKIWWKADKTGFHHIMNGKVVGEFVCDRFYPYCQAKPIENVADVERQSCLTRKEVWEYAPSGNPVGWHISDLVIYDKPKMLGDFYVEKDATTDYPMLVKMKRPPQSWCYVEELEAKDGDTNG